MGLIETLDGLELSDEQKDQIRREHEAEIQGSSVELAELRAQTRRSDVEAEVQELSDLGFREQPGLLKFVRRVLLSDDGEPGIVLLADHEMKLSGDDATGSTSREEISVAGAVRKFIELLPRDEDGKLALSDQALASNAGDPPDNDDDDQEKKTNAARERLGAPKRTRKRYSGRHTVAGGDA